MRDVIATLVFSTVATTIPSATIAQTASAPYVSVPYVGKTNVLIFSDAAPQADPERAPDFSAFGQPMFTAQSVAEVPSYANYVSVESVGNGDGEWISVVFGESDLGSNSTITIRTVDGGQSQTFDGDYLRQSGGHTPMFPGGIVYVQLNKSGEDEGVYYVIDELLIGTPANKENTIEGFPPSSEQLVEPIEAICGEDDRVPVLDKRIGRLMPVGCTGWNIRDNIHVTAGHCMRGSRMLQYQVNVPLSDPNGEANIPALEDQFVIIQDSIEGVDLGIGNDFAIFRTLPNNQGAFAHNLHGEIELATAEPGVKTDFEVVGYGVDDHPAGQPPLFRNQFSQTQQHHIGPMVEVNPTTIKHQVDTRGGNSGGPILIPNTDPLSAIGIHTHGGCVTDGANHGTNAEHPDFKALLP